MNERMTTKEAAEYLKLAVMTLHNYRHHETGPDCIRDGRRCYYEVHALDTWQAERMKRQAKRDANREKRLAKAASRKSQNGEGFQAAA